jgi:hypothetical protein
MDIYEKKIEKEIKDQFETPNIDELDLDYIDDDIKRIFKGKNYYIGTPTMAQLVKEMKLLREAIKLNV